MAKLKDLVNVNIGRDTITVQGVKLPVIFTMESFPYVAEAYGKEYEEFERDLNAMMQKGTVSLGHQEMKLMISLVYGMVRAGGTECTPAELSASIPPSDLLGIFTTVIGIFTNQTFQHTDVQLINQVQTNASKKNKKKVNNRRK